MRQVKLRAFASITLSERTVRPARKEPTDYRLIVAFSFVFVLAALSARAQWSNDNVPYTWTSRDVGVGWAPLGKFTIFKTTALPGSGWGHAQLVSVDPMGVNKGGVMNFGGIYTTSGSYADWAAIAGLKNNANDGDYGGILTFYTRTNGSATAERMRLTTDGTLQIASSSADAATVRLNVYGSGNFTGTLTANSVVNAVYGQDVAEWVRGDRELASGTVVIVNPLKTNEVMPSSTPYDTTVAGVVSAQPGVVLGRPGELKATVATSGRVRVRVDARKGAIHVGDLLVTSDEPGTAMKSQPIEINGRKFHQPGTILGKALEPLEEGTGEILVLLCLG